MKKIIILSLGLIMALGLSNCKKEEDNNGGTTTPQETCLLKSTKEVTSTPGDPDEYEGFVIYRDSKGVINRINLLDSATGDEDKTSYFLLSYSGDNLTDIKIFQQGTQFVNLAMTYSSNNKVEQRFFDLETPFGLAKINQKYFYDNQGRIDYSTRTTTLDNVPNVGKIVSKDSALYRGYNTFNRPGGVTQYVSVTTSQGTQPYEFAEEYAYEYDANGNRTKISFKEGDINNAFEVIYSATFDLEKSFGAAEEAFKVLTKLFVDDWDNPNLNDNDFDKNLKTSETETEDGQTTTKTTTFTFNAKGNPSESKDISGNENSTTTLTYECK